MVSALILLAEGMEESEFTITYDVLVRGSVDVSSALVGSSSTSPDPSSPHSHPYVTCSRGVKIVPDLRLPDLAGGKALQYDALIIPGGAKGAETIAGNQDVQKLIAAMYAEGKVIGCICAGSLAAKAAGIGSDGAITSHPSVKDQLDKGEYRTILHRERTRADEKFVWGEQTITIRKIEWLSQITSLPVGGQERLLSLHLLWWNSWWGRRRGRKLRVLLFCLLLLEVTLRQTKFSFFNLSFSVRTGKRA